MGNGLGKSPARAGRHFRSLRFQDARRYRIAVRAHFHDRSVKAHFAGGLQPRVSLTDFSLNGRSAEFREGARGTRISFVIGVSYSPPRFLSCDVLIRYPSFATFFRERGIVDDSFRKVETPPSTLSRSRKLLSPVPASSLYLAFARSVSLSLSLIFHVVFSRRISSPARRPRQKQRRRRCIRSLSSFARHRTRSQKRPVGRRESI